MWIRIRAVIIEDEPLAVQYLAALLDDTCQVGVDPTLLSPEAICLRLARFNEILHLGPSHYAARYHTVPMYRASWLLAPPIVVMDVWSPTRLFIS